MYIIIDIQEKNNNVFMCVFHQITLAHLVCSYNFYKFIYLIELYIKVYVCVCVCV